MCQNIKDFTRGVAKLGWLVVLVTTIIGFPIGIVVGATTGRCVYNSVIVASPGFFLGCELFGLNHYTT